MSSFSPDVPTVPLDTALVRRRADELEALGLADTAAIMRRVADEADAERPTAAGGGAPGWPTAPLGRRRRRPGAPGPAAVART